MKFGGYMGIARIGNLAMLHFVNDALAACLLVSYSGTDLSINAPLVYSFAAFGLQAPIGYWMDMGKHYKKGLLAGIGLMAIFVLLHQFQSAVPNLFLFGLLGLTSAIFHSVGGAMVLKEKVELGPGIFAAPGVLGLAVGGLMPLYYPGNYVPILTLVWLLMALAAYFTTKPILTQKVELVKSKIIDLPERHDVLMMVLLFAIALRSSVWNIFQALDLGNPEKVLGMAIAACLGKILGSVLASRFGTWQFTRLALPISTILLTLTPLAEWLVYPGLALLQSTTGPMLSLMYGLMPQWPALATGICLGFSILIGGFSYNFDPEFLQNNGYLFGLGIMFVAGSIFFRSHFPSMGNTKKRP